MAHCTECDAEVTVPDDPLVGEIVDCTVCGTELETVEVSPPVLQRAPELAEDWGE
ncbi:lysine biosynthesis protein LysW [Halobacteriales archaeon SW_5_70_135]|jgi:alpha-aminoadipate carrier protein LysW|nr:MAG: lysine biosynthesis protein LysW [Halobacteriales archaeon SW_5_70_135]